MATNGVVPVSEPTDTLITKDEVTQSVVQTLRSILSGPMVVVRTLIQLGYEPVAEFRDKNFFGTVGYRRLGLLSYGRTLYKKGGIGLLFVGWESRAVEAFSRNIANIAIKKVVHSRIPPPQPLKDPTFQEEAKQYVLEVVVDSITSCLTVLATHPFNVVATRMVAQSVGDVVPKLYTNPVQALFKIYSDEGVSGLWSGLVPALLGEVAFVASISLFTRIVHKIFHALLTLPAEQTEESKPLDSIMGSIAMTGASPLFYPFGLIKTMMMVNPAKLPIAQPKFATWLDCANYLNSINGYGNRGLLRGSAIFRRFYATPVAK